MTSPTSSAARSPSAVLVSLLAETPLHPGTGQGTGIVDRPVQREQHTGFPIIPATSIKGSLREQAERHWRKTNNKSNSLVLELFGPESGDGDNLHGGALGFTDARLLAFPVRSLHRVFAWVTCPLVLARLARDLHRGSYPAAGIGAPALIEGQARSPGGGQQTIILEDISFDAADNTQWANQVKLLARLFPTGSTHQSYRDKFTQDLLLISDPDFQYLVRHATQVSARIALNDRKTTTGDGGNLWYEETIPADTLFYTLLRPEASHRPKDRGGGATADQVRGYLLELLAGDPAFIQFGGNETVGHGWCAAQVLSSWQGEQP